MSGAIDEAAAYATGAVDEVVGVAASGAESAASSAAGSMSGDAIGPMDLLLSTDPDLQPAAVQQQLGIGPVGTHLYIMVRKMLAPVLPSTAEVQGTPAIVNGGYAAYFYLTAPEPGEEPPAEEPSSSSDSSPAGWPDEEEEDHA